MKKRVISIIVTLAIIISLVPAMGITASADDRYGSFIGVVDPLFDTGSITSSNAFLRDDSNFNSTVLTAVNAGLSALKLPSISTLPTVTASSLWFAQAKSILSSVGYGRHDRIDLERFVYRLNSIFSDINSKTIVGPLVSAPALQYFIPSLTVRNDWVSLKQTTVMLNGTLTTINRPWFSVSSTQGFWLVDSAGGYPYSVVQNAPTSTTTYGYYNINSAVVNDTGLVSVSDLSIFSLEYPYQGQIKTKVIQSGDYYYIGHVVGSTTIVLCMTIDGVNYAIHANYERPQTPVSVTDTGFNPIIMGNYALDFINPASGTNFYLASQIEFQNAANNVRTADFNIDVTGSDGTSYSLTALSYGSLAGSYKLDLQKHTMSMPSNSLWYYKLPANVADLFEVGNKQLGVPYLYGGVSPSTGFDCSGLVKYVFREAGVYNFGDINANQIYNSCQAISFDQAMPGDLVAFTNSGDLPTAEKTHIGIYAGAGMMLVSPRTGDVVRYQAVNELAGRNPSYCRVPGVNTVPKNLLVLRNSDAYAAGDSFNYFTDGNDNIFNQGDTTNTQFINYGDSTVINISGGDGFSNVGGDAITLYLDDLIYDESTKTYSSMSHSAYELQNGDNYITVNYNYEYNFYIDYTSITYIGTTADANETYNFYYELPDGRSSADLSGEDLLALNTQIDVIPYSRSSDDTSLRSLYHFNGNTADSSYWNLQTDFTWNAGASITYLDAGQNFQGALYLDELIHDFTITLPSSLGSGDFTFEFRYYQSYTAAPQTDSYIMFGNNKLLQFDGAHYKNSSGTTITDTSIGNWNALCLMRKNSTLYFFVNGVRYNLGSNSAVLPADITFYFGTSQQTYKQLDELRVVNRAVYSTSGYTPASTQFDTNLSLVLPGTATPVADEYWDISMTGANLLSQANLDWWDAQHSNSGTLSSNLSIVPFSYTDRDKTMNTYVNNVVISNLVNFYIPSFSFDPSFPRITVPYIPDYGTPNFSLGDYTRFYSPSTLAYFAGPSQYPSMFLSPGMQIHFYNRHQFMHNESRHYSYSSLDSGFYTFSMVSSSGEIGSISFEITNPYSISGTATRAAINFNLLDSITFNGYYIEVYSCLSANSSFDIFLNIRSVNSYGGEFVYLALEQGSQSTVSAEYVTSIVPIETSQLNTPTLAVRTDIDITSWNIGGVRPSIPSKGMAWALVEDGIITSLQVYDGQGWTNVDGRIWTGQRFVPLGSYNVLTMNDLLDIIGNSPGYTPIYTENGFWKWLQGAWQDMIALLTEIRDRLSGDYSDDGGGHTTNVDINDIWGDDDGDDDDDDDDDGADLFKLFKAALRGLLKVATGVVGLVFDGLEAFIDWIGGVGGFFSQYRVNSADNIWAIPVEVTPTP